MLLNVEICYQMENDVTTVCRYHLYGPDIINLVHSKTAACFHFNGILILMTD